VDNDAAQISNLPNYPLERIDIPTLIVHGEADATVSYAHARAAADAIPDARLVTITGGTHETLFADGRAVNAIAAFLAEHTATFARTAQHKRPGRLERRTEAKRVSATFRSDPHRV
jgi:dipeptidyl aminopeptidase/acylaminoacyl peptidase